MPLLALLPLLVLLLLLLLLARRVLWKAVVVVGVVVVVVVVVLLLLLLQLVVVVAGQPLVAAVEAVGRGGGSRNQDSSRNAGDRRGVATRSMRGRLGDLSKVRAENEYVDAQMKEGGYDLVGGQWVGGVAKAGDSAERLEADRACREEKFLRAISSRSGCQSSSEEGGGLGIRHAAAWGRCCRVAGGRFAAKWRSWHGGWTGQEQPLAPPAAGMSRG